MIDKTKQIVKYLEDLVKLSRELERAQITINPKMTSKEYKDLIINNLSDKINKLKRNILITIENINVWN